MVYGAALEKPWTNDRPAGSNPASSSSVRFRRPVAQRRERWPYKPVTQVRFLPGLLFAQEQPLGARTGEFEFRLSFLR